MTNPTGPRKRTSLSLTLTLSPRERGSRPSGSRSEKIRTLYRFKVVSACGAASNELRSAKMVGFGRILYGFLQRETTSNAVRRKGVPEPVARPWLAACTARSHNFEQIGSLSLPARVFYHCFQCCSSGFWSEERSGVLAP